MVSFMFIGLVVTILLTPGPTNTLLALGWNTSRVKQSLKLIPAEVMGYLIAITSWVFCLSHFHILSLGFLPY